MQNDPYPTTSPPPYPGPPGPSQQQVEYVAGRPQVTVIHPPTTTVIQGVVVGNPMGPSPTRYVCPSCNVQIITRVERIPAFKTHLFAVLLCIFGFWPCVCIPYCVDSCNNSTHYCPNCNAYIGSYGS